METHEKIELGILAIILLIFIESGILMITEGWDFFIAFYTSVVTISTVGYGDYVPKTFIGKLSVIIYIFVGVGTVAYTLGNVAGFLIEGHFRKYFRLRKMEDKIKKLNNHYIICGYGRLGKIVAEEFKKSKIPFVIIDSDEKVLEEALEKDPNLICIVGDATSDDVLKKARIEKARGLITVVTSDAENVFITLSAKKLNPNIYVVAKADKPSTLDKLIKAGADRAVCPYIVGGMEIARIAINPDIVEFIHSLIAVEEDIEVRRYVIKNKELDNKLLKDSGIREKSGATILAIKKGNKMITSPPSDIVINVGDVIYAFGTREQLEKLKKYVEGL
ncbi:potassium channel family protein [Methanocaldococcus fervens]|uniref:TrkA-N domain protein n=1 Tax=Methanocaldococcus fervens (strain DSM 4213 / JCM 15782 / AG86) TaxID=573064 RepID=C7P762_METFA|nr:potassium channel protein [Methanocaldococcus fervens]ACV24394.1 TrkA-N domain protein [Methanocaldococcus fervens AG86]